MAGEQTVDALLDSLSKLKEQLGTLRLDKDALQSALGGEKPSSGNSLILLESLATIREGASQKVIIDTMLRQIAKQCRGCCMVLLGSGSATVWLGPGFGLGDNEKAGSRKLPVTVQEESLVKRAAATGDAVVSSWPATETEEDIYRTIGMSEPSHMVLIPMTINGRVQAVIIGDEEKGQLRDPAAMAIIVATAATTIEHLPFRDRIGYSRFPRIEGESAPAQVAAPARPELVAEPKVEKPQQAAAPVVEEKAPEPEPVVEKPQPPVVEKPVEEPSAPKEEPAAAAPSATYGETIDSYSKELEAELGDDAEEEKPAVPADAAPLTEAASFEETEFEIEVTDEDVSDVLAGADDADIEPDFDAADLDQDAGGMEIDFLESPELADAPAPELTTGPTIEAATEESAPVETPKEAPEPAAASSEKEPEAEPAAPAAKPAAEEPSSKPVEINYEAFGLTGYDLEKYDGDTRKQHEKAIRFARLLVSEIKLYNEDAVKQGREKSDLISRLKDDITRSEALYKQRISAPIREQSNYFHDEMVRQLAEGDESLLGE